MECPEDVRNRFSVMMMMMMIIIIIIVEIKCTTSLSVLSAAVAHALYFSL